MSDVSKEYLGVSESDSSIRKLEAEIKYLEEWYKECNDENIKRSLKYMIESRKRTLEALRS